MRKWFHLLDRSRYIFIIFIIQKPSPITARLAQTNTLNGDKERTWEWKRAKQKGTEVERERETFDSNQNKVKIKSITIPHIITGIRRPSCNISEHSSQTSSSYKQPVLTHKPEFWPGKCFFTNEGNWIYVLFKFLHFLFFLRCRGSKGLGFEKDD